MYNDQTKPDCKLKLFMKQKMVEVDVSGVQDGQVFMVELGEPVLIPAGMIVDVKFALEVTLAPIEIVIKLIRPEIISTIAHFCSLFIVGSIRIRTQVFPSN